MATGRCFCRGKVFSYPCMTRSAISSTLIDKGASLLAKHKSASLLLRLWAVYIAALFGGSIFIFLNNLLIHGSSLKELLTFNIPFVLISDVFFSILLLGISYWRLRPVLRYLRHPSDNLAKELVFVRIIRFPMSLFWGMIGLSLFFIFLYHATSVIAMNVKSTIAEWISIITAELNLALILAIFLLSMSRRLLRRYAEQLNVQTFEWNTGQSAVRMMAVFAASCFIIALTPDLRTLIDDDPGQPDMASYWILAGIYCVFAVGIFSLSIIELRQELRMLIDRMKGLSKRDNDHLHHTFPILSLDETGRLTAALNDLQHRVESAYEEINEQLKLAHAVQRKLLPAAIAPMKELDFAVSCRQCHEVGGDFYDWIPLGNDRYCAAIGDVSGKGLPAALLMTAVMAGLRMQATKGGSPGEILTRLNGHVHQITQGKDYVTMGLAVIEVADGSVNVGYASAGHLDPYLIRDGRVMDWSGGSLPLGIAPDERYQERRESLSPGDLLVLYTDGIIENRPVAGKESGFERLEKQLRRIAPRHNLQVELHELFERMGLSSEEEAQDDQTLFLIKRTAD